MGAPENILQDPELRAKLVEAEKLLREVALDSGCPVESFVLGGGVAASDGYDGGVRTPQQTGATAPATPQPFIGVYPQGDPLAGTDATPAGFGWNDGQAVHPNYTRLRCA